MLYDDTDVITKAGINKSSFELYYNGGSIWCEHLDGMGKYAEKVKEKFWGDFKTLSKPSMTSFIIINLDKTILDNDLVSWIADTIIQSSKRFMKIAFVGVQHSKRAALRKIQYNKGCAVSFFDDYERAKQWLLP